MNTHPLTGDGCGESVMHCVAKVVERSWDRQCTKGFDMCMAHARWRSIQALKGDCIWHYSLDMLCEVSFAIPILM